MPGIPAIKGARRATQRHAAHRLGGGARLAARDAWESPLRELDGIGARGRSSATDGDFGSDSGFRLDHFISSEVTHGQIEDHESARAPGRR